MPFCLLCHVVFVPLHSVREETGVKNGVKDRWKQRPMSLKLSSNVEPEPLIEVAAFESLEGELERHHPMPRPAAGSGQIFPSTAHVSRLLTTHLTAADFESRARRHHMPDVMCHWPLQLTLTGVV
jgi:hypothetical protein